SSYQPELVIPNRTLNFIFNGSEKVIWDKESIPSIDIINAGSGIAKNINFDWNFCRNITESITNLDHEKKYKIKESDRTIFIERFETIYVKNKSNIEYILPISSESTVRSIYLPPAVLLYPIYLLLTIEVDPNMLLDEEVILEINYEDMNGKKYKVKKELTISLMKYDKSSFEGTLLVRVEN